MRVYFVPTHKGMGEQELKGRIQAGWIYFGRQAVVTPPIISLSNPNAPAGIMDVDIWVLPEPTVPLSVLAQILVKVHEEQEDATLALDDVARAVFGQGIIPLCNAVISAATETREEDGRATVGGD